MLIVSDSLQPHGLQPSRVLCLWNSPGKSTGEGIHSLLQEIFLTQGLNAGLLQCKQIFYHLSHQKSPRNCLKLQDQHSPRCLAWTISEITWVGFKPMPPERLEPYSSALDTQPCYPVLGVLSHNLILDPRL